MNVVFVYIQVKNECIEGFKEATLENARNSIKEPGVVRFDMYQQADDPTRFVLVEAYRTPEAPLQHKEAEHYKKWRDTVADMMAEPRQGIKHINLFPDDEELG